MRILAWIVVGLIAGWLASRVMRGGGYGLIGDIIGGAVSCSPFYGRFLLDTAGRFEVEHWRRGLCPPPGESAEQVRSFRNSAVSIDRRCSSHVNSE